METVVGDISEAIQQLKNLSDVRLEKCCDELIRGVVDGVSESDGSLSLSVNTGSGLLSLSLSVDKYDSTRYGRIEFKEQSLHVEGM